MAIISQRCKVAFFSLLFTIASQAYGQNYERYAPVQPSVQPLANDRVPRPQLEDVVGDDRELVKSLDAVIIVDSPTKISKSENIDSLEGIHYEFAASDSLVFRPSAQRIIQKRLGDPITLRRLNELARELILLYRNCKQPIVDVQIPEQRITGGTVQLIVIESHIENVHIQPGCYFDCDQLSRWIECTQVGNRIYEPHLESDLLWLNQNPFRRVAVDFQKGQAPGTTDVIYRVNDVYPLRGYLGSDDSGVQTLNFGRFYGGFTYGNLFGKGGILGYQFTMDDDFSLLKAHAISLTQPINRRWSWEAYGSWASVSPALGFGLSQEGESWQLGTGFSQHLIRTRQETANLTFGIDFKSTNNNLEFAGSNIAASDADLVQLRIGYDHLWRGQCPDRYSLLRLEGFLGPGEGMTGAHSSTAFESLRPNTSPDYAYARLLLEDSRPLDNHFQILTRFTGQVATERLLFSETLGLGGFDTLRGFDQRVFNADHGWIANIELGPKAYRWGCEDDHRVLRAYGFLDVGNGYIEEPLSGEDSYVLAVSAGVGFRFQLGTRLTARFDYGFGIENIAAAGRNDRAHLGITWIPGVRP